MSAPKLLRSSAVFSAMTMLSRLAGFVRDMVQAALFPVGAATDAFAIVYRIPNYLRRIFAEGSFSMAFVPIYNELRERGDEAALKQFLDHVAGALCAVVLAVTALGVLAAPLVVGAIAPGTWEDPAKFELASTMLRIVFPYLFFISLTALAGAVLNSLGRFALPAVTPVLHNLVMIAAMLWLRERFDIPAMALAWGAFFAGFAQFALLWPSLARYGMLPRFRLNLRDEGVQRVWKLMLPTLFSSSVAQLNLIVGTMFASVLATGSQTWLYFSDRLVEFPLGLIGVAIGTVILPHLSRRHASTDAHGFNAGVDWGLRMVVLAGVPAGLGLLLLAEPLTITMFQRGEFELQDARMTALALSAMSVAVPAFMLSKVLSSAFYSRQDSTTPMRIAIRTVFINVALTVALTAPLWWSGFAAAHVGIAAATSVSGICNAVLLWRALRRGEHYAPLQGWGRLIAQVAAGCVVMAACVLALRGWLGDWGALTEQRRWAWLAAAVTAGAAGYAITLVAAGLRPRHLREH